MKKLAPILLVLVICSTQAFGEQYSSPFGFAMDIPSHWLIVSAQEAKKNPGLFNNEIFKNINRSMIEKIKEMVSSGKVEFYYNQKTADSRFNDNINVVERIGQIPQNISEGKKLCDSFPGQISDAYGKAIKVYSCGLKKVSGCDAFYMEYDGLVIGTRCITYEIQKSQSIILTLTVTCKNQSLTIIKKEFEGILASINMK